MSKVAVFCIPAYGHVNPQMALVDGLVKAGEHVTYYTSPRFAPIARRTGADVRVISTSLDSAVDTMGATIGRNAFSVARMVMDASEEILGRIFEEVSALDPDYVIHDSITLFGRVIAKALKKPGIATVPVFCFDERTIPRVPHMFRMRMAWQFLLSGLPESARYLAAAARISKRYGTNIEDLFYIYNDYAELNIVTTSRQFQFHSEAFPEPRFKFVGPMLFEKRDDGGFPFERLKPGKSVYISLGTVYNNEVDFFRECIRAFKSTGYSVVMSCGNSVDIKSLGELPDNIYAANYIPQLQIMPHISAFVTHAGMNSTHEALLNGVPLVCVPQANDQYVISHRVRELGAGVIPGRPDADDILDAVEKVLGNHSYAEKAAGIGEQLKASGGVDAAVKAIMEFKAQKGIK